MTRILITGAALLTAGPALAGVMDPGVPGPLVGAGVPALIGLAYLYRRLRRSR